MKKFKKAKLLNNGLNYSSDKNKDFLTIKELNKFVKEFQDTKHNY